MVNAEIQKLLDKLLLLSKSDKKDYNEANTANVFIRPLFGALGWDFSNFNEIEAEKAIVKGRVDYVFKIHNVSKFCVEIKSLRHELNDDDREQAINYAYHKGVTWAILTNFLQIQVFNAEVKTTDVNSVLFLNLGYQDYVSDYESLYLLSKESALNENLDQRAEKYGKLAKRIPIEERLYQELIKWRGQLSNEIFGYYKDKGVTLSKADELIQTLFSRLLFIRTAEDRDLAGDHPLLSALHQWETKKGNLINDIRKIFRDFSITFDSELFPKEEDDQWGHIEVFESTLADVVNGLYSVPGDFAKYNFNIIEPDVLGQVYEQYLGYVARKVLHKKGQPSLFPADNEGIELTPEREKRKKSGIYYTPKWVTDYIVKQTLNRYFDEHSYEETLNIKILDPACGSGSFLIRAYDELLSYHARMKKIPVSELTWSERKKILTNNIYGVDLDQQAVEISRLNLLIRALSQRDLLPTLGKNIQRGNSLIFGTDNKLEEALGSNFLTYNPFNWQVRFPNIKAFDIVIGNPPYVMELRDNKDTFRPLQLVPLGQKYYEPKMDIFYFFMELGIDLLKPDGYMGFIVQQYWISRSHASKLRKKVFMEESHPLVLIDFDGYQVFKDAPGQHNMITILQKARSDKDKTLVLQLKEPEVTQQEIVKALSSDTQDQDIFNADIKNTPDLYDVNNDKVYLVKDDTSDILSKLKENSFNLDDKEIQQGVVTPQHFLTASALFELDKPRIHEKGEGIFVLSKSELKQLNLTKDELKLMRPFHYAEEIGQYYYAPGIHHYLIYTPNEMAKLLEDNPQKYPHITKHLDQYQDIITSDHKPYGLHRARQPEWFDDKLKIVSVRKTMYPKFALIPNKWYADQSVFIIRLVVHKDISPYYTLGILNSLLSHFYLYQQKRQGDQLQVDKDVLIKFPFPNIDLTKRDDKLRYDNVVTSVNQIIELRKEVEKVKTGSNDIFGEKAKTIQSEIDKIMDKINKMVFELYDLNKSEINVINQWHDQIFP